MYRRAAQSTHFIIVTMLLGILPLGVFAEPPESATPSKSQIQSIERDLLRFQELSEKASITEINRDTQRDYHIDVAVEAAVWFRKNQPSLPAGEIADRSLKIKEYCDRNFGESSEKLSEAEREQGLHDFVEFLEPLFTGNLVGSAKSLGTFLLNGARRELSSEKAEQGSSYSKDVFGGSQYIPFGPRSGRMLSHFSKAEADTVLGSAVDRILEKVNHGASIYNKPAEFRAKNQESFTGLTRDPRPPRA